MPRGRRNFVVSKILNTRQADVVEYCVSWVGYTDKYNTWLLEGHGDVDSYIRFGSFYGNAKTISHWDYINFKITPHVYDSYENHFEDMIPVPKIHG